MNIIFNYRYNLEFSKEEDEFLRIKSGEFGVVEVKTYYTKSGTIDLVSIIETILTFTVLNNSKSFLKGLIGDDFFRQLGTEVRQELLIEIQNLKGFIEAYYKVFIKRKKDESKAFVISVMIEDIRLYVALNHSQMTDELLESLPQTLVISYGKIIRNHIEVESKICQLFPDFENNKWSYLFVPTINGFGNYIDQYFDFEIDQLIQVNSKSDFLERFKINDLDLNKLIINPQLNSK